MPPSVEPSSVEPSSVEPLKEHACFGGRVTYYRHYSTTCNSPMHFAVFVPPQAESEPVPALYYLSGLTCTEDNFMVKAGAQRYAAEYGLMLVAPDTSPRDTGTPGEADAWDLGVGAGFYVDATQSPWNQHYQMYRYVTQELPQLIQTHFRVRGDRQGIFGHSMGGHGALVCGLRNPDQFQSISAFAPICAPMQCPWGTKAFGHYLGTDPESWRQYDASQLVRHYADPNRVILIDQGTDDTFLESQLLPQVFEAACREAGQPLMLRQQKGYDHSYFFIATFMADHIRHHAKVLCLGAA